MDANTILDALKPATAFILDSLKKNDALGKVLQRAGLEAIAELPEDPLTAQQKLEDRFDAEQLLRALQQTFAAGTKNQPIRVGELEALSLVAQVLLDLQRYYRWRSLSFANRTARAASRRAINAGPTGPVIHSLQTAVQRTLREANAQ